MNTTMVATSWWFCPDCGVEAELPSGDGAGTQLPCPDCPGELAEHWCWSSAA